MLSRVRKIFRVVFDDHTMPGIFIILDALVILILVSGLGADFKRDVFTFSFAEPARLLILKLYLGMSFLAFVAMLTVVKYWEVRAGSAGYSRRAVLLRARWTYAFNWPWMPAVLITALVAYYAVKAFFGFLTLPGLGLGLFMNRVEAERARQEARLKEEERIIEEEARRAGGTMGLKR